MAKETRSRPQWRAVMGGWGNESSRLPSNLSSPSSYVHHDNKIKTPRGLVLITPPDPGFNLIAIRHIVIVVIFAHSLSSDAPCRSGKQAKTSSLAFYLFVYFHRLAIANHSYRDVLYGIYFFNSNNPFSSNVAWKNKRRAYFHPAPAPCPACLR